MLGEVSSLEDLSERSGRAFPYLIDARERTAAGLQERSTRLDALPHSQEVAVVLMGSWGRAEVTSGSDDDFMVLVHGGEQDPVEPSVESVARILDHSPGSQGIFGVPVFSESLVEHIGLDGDDNKNLTRRMLLMLESRAVTGEDAYEDVRNELLDRYLDESVKSYRPPRFFLNDVVRYWRTMCVDFAGKEHEGPDKWGLRNAKLRTSRKILFAGGLLPILECFRFDEDEMRRFLKDQLDRPPTDRIARSFLTHDAVDAGARTLGAYDEFVGRLDDEEFRRELRTVVRWRSGESPAFADVRRIAHDVEQGLLALLYETRELPQVARDYAIF
ncbi:MAG: hypothetical protein ACTHN3_04690 [Solirubrobacterales bacterium]